MTFAKIKLFIEAKNTKYYKNATEIQRNFVQFKQIKIRKRDAYEQIRKKFKEQIPAAGVSDGTGRHDGDDGNARFFC